MTKENNLTSQTTTDILILLGNENIDEEDFKHHIIQIKKLCRYENTYEQLCKSFFFPEVSKRIPEFIEKQFSTLIFRSIIELATNCLAVLPKASTTLRVKILKCFLPEILMSLSFLDISSDLLFHFLQNGQRDTIDLIKAVPSSTELLFWLFCLESNGRKSGENLEKERMCHYFIYYLLKCLRSDLFVQLFFCDEIVRTYSGRYCAEKGRL
eukprot:GHVP01003190.1.p1 GENE.GHVP01003190.1~~GHVP01003190.1.p1  ORF type:complete len:211 (+),score=29.35 GHVP01003190.1:116-748(+)